jgi:hypothetical protein
LCWCSWTTDCPARACQVISPPFVTTVTWLRKGPFFLRQPCRLRPDLCDPAAVENRCAEHLICIWVLTISFPSPTAT